MSAERKHTWLNSVVWLAVAKPAYLPEEPGLGLSLSGSLSTGCHDLPDCLPEDLEGGAVEMCCGSLGWRQAEQKNTKEHVKL